MNNHVSEPLKSIIDTFAQYGQPAAVERSKALYDSVMEERYRGAVKSLALANEAYSQAQTLGEIEAAFANCELAEYELDSAHRMMMASRTRVPYPNYKGD